MEWHTNVIEVVLLAYNAAKGREVRKIIPYC